MKEIIHTVAELFYAEGDTLFAKDPYVNGMRLAYYHEKVLWKKIAELKKKLARCETCDKHDSYFEGEWKGRAEKLQAELQEWKKLGSVSQGSICNPKECLIVQEKEARLREVGEIYEGMDEGVKEVVYTGEYYLSITKKMAAAAKNIIT
jgi:hypothetical protein